MIISSRTDIAVERCTFASRLFERDLLIGMKSPRFLFSILDSTFNFKFPKHFFFGNFHCLRCGECCKYYAPPIKVHTAEIKRWIRSRKRNILGCIWCFKKEGYCVERLHENSTCVDCDSTTKQIERKSSGEWCPFLRRVRKKPYYRCSNQKTKPETCSGYLCQKSLPVAHLRWKNVNELIAKIGLHAYAKLRNS